MNFRNLAKLIFKEIEPKLKTNKGLSVFAKERSKFEGWLKVELCASLSNKFKDIAPERNRIDITFSNWAIELKTVNTNILYKNVKDKKRPITRNTEGVIKDIRMLKKLKSFCYSNRAVLFIAFPITHDNKNWQMQLQRIRPLVKKLKHYDFNFRGDIPAVIYFGII